MVKRWPTKDPTGIAAVVSVRLSPGQRDRLDRIAAALGTTRTDAVRYLINLELEDGDAPATRAGAPSSSRPCDCACHRLGSEMITADCPCSFGGQVGREHR